MLLFAVAVFLFMRGSRIAEAPSYLAYNLGALAERSVYSVDATEDGRLREVLLAAKGILDAGLLRGRVGLAVCIALSACLFFLPTLETALWWVPIIVGLVFRDAHGEGGGEPLQTRTRARDGRTGRRQGVLGTPLARRARCPCRRGCVRYRYAASASIQVA